MRKRSERFRKGLGIRVNGGSCCYADEVKGLGRDTAPPAQGQELMGSWSQKEPPLPLWGSAGHLPEAALRGPSSLQPDKTPACPGTCTPRLHPSGQTCKCCVLTAPCYSWPYPAA